ncbi:hypothetical protein QJ857_gp0062 [Tupanvirus soda lake]|uniref:Uncharacterized protein n=2 Tax=Tupanvirus TaxID=2094720 RepID=A0A6N1P4R2_9VIRU|nr:hypothetical protein QJ857_gp0062 [Tupanvirus soda lake]QKU35961.1 hypothetical protein [Tupanvirus soda lake]
MNFPKKCNNPACEYCLDNKFTNKNIHSSDFEFPIEESYNERPITILTPPCNVNKEECYNRPPPPREECYNRPPLQQQIECCGNRPPHPPREKCFEPGPNSDMFEPNSSEISACSSEPGPYYKNIQRHGPNHHNKIPYNTSLCSDDFIVTDEYLLDYLLKKYKLDKHKLILSIKKSKENETKLCILRDFYKYNKNLIKICMPIKEQYKIFKKWNGSDINISKEELEDYYENYIKGNLY